VRIGVWVDKGSEGSRPKGATPMRETGAGCGTNDQTRCVVDPSRATKSARFHAPNLAAPGRAKRLATIGRGSKGTARRAWVLEKIPARARRRKEVGNLGALRGHVHRHQSGAPSNGTGVTGLWTRTGRTNREPCPELRSGEGEAISGWLVHGLPRTRAGPAARYGNARSGDTARGAQFGPSRGSCWRSNARDGAARKRPDGSGVVGRRPIPKPASPDDGRYESPVLRVRRGKAVRGY